MSRASQGMGLWAGEDISKTQQQEAELQLKYIDQKEKPECILGGKKRDLSFWTPWVAKPPDFETKMFGTSY